MSTQYFVFSDDLDIFRTPDAVTAYLEPWIVERSPMAFDSEGRVLKLSIEVVKRRSFFGFFSSTKEKLVLKPTDEIKPEILQAKLMDYMGRLDSTFEKDNDYSLAKIRQAVVEKKGFTA